MAISSPLSSLSASAKDTTKKTVSISKTLTKSIEAKKSLATSKSLFRKRRIEFGKRVSLRERFLVPNIVVRPKGPRALALSDTSTSVVDRLLGFIGYLSAGWILSNMPTWIALGKQFSSRLSIAGGILRNYGDESVRAMNELKNVFGAALENISRFDFTDSSYLVRSSLNDLKLEIDSLGVGLSEAFAVLLKPFKDVPELGTYQPDEPTPTPTPTPSPGGTGPSGAAYGVNLKALADATSQAEGTYSSVGPTTYLGHGLGRYQFMTGRSDVQSIILNNAGNEKPKAQSLINRSLRGDRSAAKQLLKYFPPSSQDSLFSTHAQNTLTQIKRRYPNADESFLVQKFGVYHLTGGDYPNSRDVNGTSGKEHGDKILREYKKLKGKSSQTLSPASTLANLSSPANAILGLLGLSPNKPGVTGQRRLQSGDIFTKSLGKDVEYIQVTSLVGDGRNHGGIDIAAPLGTYIALRVDCEVVAQGTYGDYGLLIDVWIPSIGIQLRMTHLSSVLIKSGKIPAGTSFARVGKSGRASGPHIHLEYDTKKGMRGGGAINDDPNYAATLDQYVRLLLLTKNPNKGKFSPAAVSSVSLIPGTPSISMNAEEQVEMETNSYLAGLLTGITQEREGRKILIIDDRASGGVQQVISSGSGDNFQSQVPESMLLNNFIKQKLLLDLTYL